MAPDFTTAKLNRQWKENSRLRLGVSIVCLIMLLYTCLIIDDKTQELTTECQQLAQQVEKLNSLSQQTIWLERAEKIRDAKVKALLRLFQAETPGLAQAKIQNLFDKKIQSSGLKKLRLDVGHALVDPDSPALYSVTVKVQGHFTSQALAKFLKAIETSDQIITVSELDITRKNEKNRFTMVCKAWFLTSEQDTGGRF